MRKVNFDLMHGAHLGIAIMAAMMAALLFAWISLAQGPDPSAPATPEVTGVWNPPVGTPFKFDGVAPGRITVVVTHTAALTMTGAYYTTNYGGSPDTHVFTGTDYITLTNANQTAIFDLASIWPYTSGEKVQFYISPEGGGLPLISPDYTIQSIKAKYLPIISTIGFPQPFFKQTPASESTNTPISLTLSWTSSAYASYYEVCLSSTSDDCVSPNPTGYTRTASSASYSTGLLEPNKMYYWHVRARNYRGVVYSDGDNMLNRWRFTTGTPPGAFEKTTPENGAAVFPATGGTLLSWDASSGATSNYDICLSKYPAACTNASNFIYSTPATSWQTPSLDDGATYYWHVRASNATGPTYSDGSPSAVYSFIPRNAVVPGTDACSAFPATPGMNYLASQQNNEGFFALTVNTASTVYMTVTNFSGGGQLQFRTPIMAGSCTSTFIDFNPNFVSGSAAIYYFNVTPGTYYARIYSSVPNPSNTYTFRWDESVGASYLEPNNSACAAWPVAINTTYVAYPENSRPDLDLGSGVGTENDFYQFSLGATTNIAVNFSSYQVITSQVQLLMIPAGGTCANRTLVDSTSFAYNQINGVINRTLVAGTYYARFVTTGGAQSKTPYAFNIGTGGVYIPAVDTCTAFQNCQANSTDGTLTIYWRGMTGASYLQVWLRSWGLYGCTAGDPNSASPSGYVSGYKNLPVTIGDSGSFVFSNFSTGSYAFFVNANPTANLAFHDEKTFRVKCGFRNFWAPYQPPVVGPDAPDYESEPMPTPVP